VASLLGAGLLVSACAPSTRPLPEAPEPSPTPAPPIVFPNDALPHSALTEWWYFTGHLSGSDGHRYGFEFVVFQVERQAVPTAYLAHFAMSDIDRQTFSHQARFSQGQTFTSFPLSVGGWTLAHEAGGDDISAAMQPGPGAEAAYAVQLHLADQKPPALHNGGYISYAEAGGSYYYSRTRLAVTGSLTGADGESTPVAGIAWMDHQWGNFIITGSVGWDWYSVQLDDGTELMLYVLRSTTGETTGVYGSRILEDGSVQGLAPGSVRAAATGSWTSPHTGAVYPSGWQLLLPDGTNLTLSPQLRDQELWFPGAPPASTLAYWEGAVTVSGDRSGVGYVELTGYASGVPAGVSGTGP
jgi:predicted secreted hydrolase